MSSHRNTELNQGLYQVYLWLNRQSTEGKGESCSWFCSTSEDSKRASPFQEIAEKAKSAHAVGLLTEWLFHVSLMMKWWWLLPEEAETGLFGVQWLCDAKANAILSQEYIWSIIVLAMPFLKYNFKVYMKLILSAYLLSRWCGLLCFSNYHRQNVPLECHYWKFSLVWSIKVGVGLLGRKF